MIYKLLLHVYINKPSLCQIQIEPFHYTCPLCLYRPIMLIRASLILLEEVCQKGQGEEILAFWTTVLTSYFTNLDERSLGRNNLSPPQENGRPPRTQSFKVGKSKREYPTCSSPKLEIETTLSITINKIKLKA